MTLEEIKSFLLQLEAEKKNTDETRGPKIQMVQRIPEWQSGPHAKCFRCNKRGHMAPNCPLKPLNRWFCYFCNAETDHKGNNYNKDYTTHNNTNNYTQIRGNIHIRGRGNNRGNLPRGGGRGNFRGRVFKQRGNRGARGAAQNTLKQGATAYIAGTTKDINKLKTQTQIAFTADSGAIDHIVNKGIILSDFKQCTGEVIRSANKNDSANIEIDGKGNLVVKSNINKDEIIILKT